MTKRHRCRFCGRWSLVTLAFSTALLAGLHGNAQADTYPPCTSTSTGLCEIQFDELVADIPGYLRTALSLHPTDNPVAISRFAVVWPGDGTLTNPPVVVFHGGHPSTADGNVSLGFHVEWPPAIVVYTEAGRLVDHDGQWRAAGNAQLGDTDWSPRFPHTAAGADHTDLDYLGVVLDTVGNLFPYNAEQVYAAGHSSGGYFTLSLMTFMPETFRAFAVLGSRADFERKGDDIAAIVAAGQKLPSRPVLYMMGEKEDIFPWQPAIPGADDKVYDTVRQLTARNGADVPGQDEADYLVNLTNAVRTATVTNRVGSLTFEGVKPNSAEVVMLVYGGDHSWPPRDADDPGLRATEWAVDFFQQHLDVEPVERNVLFDQGWTVPVLMLPVLF